MCVCFCHTRRTSIHLNISSFVPAWWLNTDPWQQECRGVKADTDGSGFVSSSHCCLDMKNPQRYEFGHILVCAWSRALRSPPLWADQMKLTASLKIADCATSKLKSGCGSVYGNTLIEQKMKETERDPSNEPNICDRFSSWSPKQCFLQTIHASMEMTCKCCWFIWYHVSSSETEVAKKAHYAVFAFARITLFVC